MNNRERIIRVEERRKADRRVHNAEMAARDRAIEMVDRATRETKVQQNEWRGALSDLASHKVDGATFTTAMGSLGEKVDLLRQEVSETRGGVRNADRSRALGFALIGAAVAVLGLVVAYLASR